MTAVLVLNATYEPISRTRVARAIALVQRGDAVIDESIPGRMIRHKSGVMPWPRVVRLLRYVRVPIQYAPAAWSKTGVLRRDKHQCGYCGRTATTVDHIMPTSRGGARRDWMNTVAACTRCNGKKADKTPAEAGMVLSITPHVPMKVTLGR